MAYFRRLGVMGIVGACYVLAVGCSDDEDRPPGGGDSGEGGESAGSSGKGGSSSGGSSNTGGKAGNTGTSGSSTAGEAGAGTAGDAGSGSGGDAGAGMGGAGGEPPIGGAAGEGGAGGEGGAPEPMAASCQYECTPGEDCTTNAGSVPCDPVTHRCVTTETSCQTKQDCNAAIAMWSPGPCTSSDDCVDAFCIASGADTYCAPPADGFCVFGVATMVPEVGGQGDVEICIASGVCIEGACEPGCDEENSGGCAGGNGDTCNAETGLCECGSGDECDTGVCMDSQCAECASDDDCPGGVLDHCVAGHCGCSSADVCADVFTNATPVCE